MSHALKSGLFSGGNALVLRHPLIIELQQADPALGSGLFIQASDMAIQHRTGKGHLLRDILPRCRPETSKYCSTSRSRSVNE